MRLLETGDRFSIVLFCCMFGMIDTITIENTSNIMKKIKIITERNGKY